MSINTCSEMLVNSCIEFERVCLHCLFNVIITRFMSILYTH